MKFPKITKTLWIAYAEDGDTMEMENTLKECRDAVGRNPFLEFHPAIVYAKYELKSVRKARN